MKIFSPTVVCFVVVFVPACSVTLAAGSLTPGEAIDFETLAFYPKRWKENGVEMKMYPWAGEQVVFLTTTPDFDGKVMAGLLRRLDGGWKLYADLTGQTPRMHKQLSGKPTLAAIPEFKLTCGYGCGYVGATGIELGAFYRTDYRNIRTNADAVPDYYFYEMGRNYYTFGDKHSLFVTGYAVFMRYVCVDGLQLKTNDKLRATIEEAEAIYAKTEMPFIKAFTTLDGLSEKQNRLQTSPTDQPVMYASAMLKLRRELGGDKWLKKFYAVLARCPAVKPKDKDSSMQQALNWFVAASCAAEKDLSPIFVDRWRMPLSPQQLQTINNIRWDADTAKPEAIIDRLLASQRKK